MDRGNRFDESPPPDRKSQENIPIETSPER